MNCVFCEIAKKNIPSKTLYEDDKVMAIMDINPICDGHILIIPKEHYETLFDVPRDIFLQMYKIAKELTPHIMKGVNENGMTFSINYGSKQEIKHLHLHLMPNFDQPATHTIEEVYQNIKEQL